MGKLRSKYPIVIDLDFMMVLKTGDYINQTHKFQLQSGSLTYNQIKPFYDEFLETHNIYYETHLFHQISAGEIQVQMKSQWNMNLSAIEDSGRFIMLIVKSSFQYYKQTTDKEIQLLYERMLQFEQKFQNNNYQKYQELDKNALYSPTNTVLVNSISQPPAPLTDLDIGVLFSQPIFDQKKHREANMPVDFRSQIQRLYSALTNSYKPQITVQCQIGTKEHLRHLIDIKKPKILHIICHGSKQGQLQFQDDSKYSIGTLSTIDTVKIRQILLQKKQSLPKLAFINSCHSQIIGKIFYQAGTKYVIMIDSQDKIDDEAAQIFSQNFYRNIFRGQKIGKAFLEAKDNVNVKHNSFGCCCRHTARQKHKQNCRWLQICKQMGENQAHKLYHIPSSKCTCQLRYLNQHNANCQWAKFALFHINRDFRIMDNGKQRFPNKKTELPAYLPFDKKATQLIICCCFNFEGQSKQPRIPHSQSNKFKILPNDVEHTQSLYILQKNVAFRTQIINHTAPQLLQYHEKVNNTSVMGRQQQLYQFMKKIRDTKLNFFILYGHPGVGKTTFAIKTATYLIERRVFQNYFFIDLYDIKDKDMLRSKFNQITKFNYPNLNKSVSNQLKNRQMIIIFDNIDQFIKISSTDFQQEIDNLKKSYNQTKFIITCKSQNLTILQNQPIFTYNQTYVKQIKVLDQNVAAKVLFSKIRNYLDISVEYMDIRALVGTKKQLLIPKVIQNLTHTFSNIKGKIKIQTLKSKVQQLGQGQSALYKLVQQNLNLLKSKCKQSYDMLIFISQFSQGIDHTDFNILSMYDRSEGKKDVTNIDIPIDKNWKKRLAILYQIQAQLPPAAQLQKINSFNQYTSLQPQKLVLDRHLTSFKQQSKPSGDDQDIQIILKGQSYFLQQLSQKRFIVKRFIRDFIWNKYNADQNYYMKHIFVAYTAVMLDIYLKYLVQQKYVHEQILQYSDISRCGIFKYKDNNYFQPSLTQSIRIVEEYNSKFQKIIKQQSALKDKIKSSQPSVFIMNHKLDFLHIYGYDWSKIYNHLAKFKNKQQNILINYLQKLVILIPTALKIAQAETSTLIYAIRQSTVLLSVIKPYTKPDHFLMLHLKLKLMKIAWQIQRQGTSQSLRQKLEIQKLFNIRDLQRINNIILQNIQAQFSYQTQLMDIYAQYEKTKQLKKLTQSSLKTGSQRTVEIISKLNKWLEAEFKWQINCQLLKSKRYLVLGMMYVKILQVSSRFSSNFTIINFKRPVTYMKFAKYANESSRLFLSNDLILLGLRAKLIQIMIIWQSIKSRNNQKQFQRQLQQLQQNLKQCEQLYEDKKNNLLGMTVFDDIIKRLKKQMKQRIWSQSINSIVIMKSSPLCNDNYKYPLLQNIMRKKQNYRDQIYKIFQNSNIDLSIKFQALTQQKLKQQCKKGANILLLNTNFKRRNGKLCIIVEDLDLKQKYIQIQKGFLNIYSLDKLKLLILMGNNAQQALNLIVSNTQGGPSIMSITTLVPQNEISQGKTLQQRYTNSEQILQAIKLYNDIQSGQINIAKQFIRTLISDSIISKPNQNLTLVYNELKDRFKLYGKLFKIKIQDKNKQILKNKKGSFNDLSPNIRRAHNLQMIFKNNLHIVYRKWKQLTQVFNQFTSQKEAVYIHVSGNNGAGKTMFCHQVGRLCVQRGLFENGVYVLDGKIIQQKYQSDFQSYISKCDVSKMFKIQSFKKFGNNKFLLIIDDFHLIIPRSNGRYKQFINDLLQKKVNIMFVTAQGYSLKQILVNVKAKQIKLQKLTDIQLNIYAYNVLQPDNQDAIKEYEAQKKKNKLSFSQILKIRKMHDRNPNMSHLNPSIEPMK